MKPHGPLSQYTGTYASDLVGELIVKKVNGSLRFQLGPNGRALRLCAIALGDRFPHAYGVRPTDFPEDWFSISFVLRQGPPLSKS